MTTPPEGATGGPPDSSGAPDSTSPPAPPRRRSRARTQSSSTGAKPDVLPDAPTDAPTDASASRRAAAVSSRTDAPAPPRRGRRQASADEATVVGEPPQRGRVRDRARRRPTSADSAPTVSGPEGLGDPPLAPTEAEVFEVTPAARRSARRVPAAPPEPYGDEDAARHGRRRFHQQLVKVDLWSATKLALCFYASAMFVTLVALVALWIIADAAGVIGNVEKFLGGLFSSDDFTFLSGEVLMGVIIVGLVMVALQVVVTVIAVSFYNIFSELFGGLEITVEEHGSEE